MVVIELYGIPRLRAQRTEVTVDADNLATAIRALGQACPALRPSVVDGEALTAQYRVALTGEHFTSDGSLPLDDGDVLVIVSAQAGG